MIKAIEDLSKLEQKYKKEEENAEDRICNYLNSPDMIDQFIDLHGQRVLQGVEIALYHLERIRDGLATGEIEPNYGDCHIYKIICGAGKHSNSGKGMLKQKMKEALEEVYDYHHNNYHGVFWGELSANTDC